MGGLIDTGRRQPIMSKINDNSTGLAVIIPVWNGRSSIKRSLTSLLEQTVSEDVSLRGTLIIVASNDGCDEAVKIAEAFNTRLIKKGYQFQIIKTPAGRKAAFEGAELYLNGQAILYLDQDAALSACALSEIITLTNVITEGIFFTLTPKFSRSSSFLVRSFLRGWQAAPYVRNSPATAGAYGVNGLGRNRWGAFPNLHSDDKLVRMQFALSERYLISSQSYETLAPDTVSELIQKRMRYRAGNAELTKYLADANSHPDVARFSGIWQALRNLPAWGDYFVLALISALVVVLDMLRKRSKKNLKL